MALFERLTFDLVEELDRPDLKATNVVVEQFRALVATGPMAFERTTFPAHFTASAITICPTSGRFLLAHHRKLNKWIQLGGHADGDSNLLRVAAREVIEESGERELVIVTPHAIDLDIHTIPAHKGVPEHVHYDVRFLFTTSSSQPLVCSHESLELRWASYDDLWELGTDASVVRAAEHAVAVLGSVDR